MARGAQRPVWRAEHHAAARSLPEIGPGTPAAAGPLVRVHQLANLPHALVVAVEQGVHMGLEGVARRGQAQGAAGALEQLLVVVEVLRADARPNLGGVDAHVFCPPAGVAARFGLLEAPEFAASYLLLAVLFLAFSFAPGKQRNANADSS